MRDVVSGVRKHIPAVQPSDVIKWMIGDREGYPTKPTLHDLVGRGMASKEFSCRPAVSIERLIYRNGIAGQQLPGRGDRCGHHREGEQHGYN
jgi:hypothetical protein